MSNHEAYDEALKNKIDGYKTQIVGEDAAFKPSGYFRVYIDKNDDKINNVMYCIYTYLILHIVALAFALTMSL